MRSMLLAATAAAALLAAGTPAAGDYGHGDEIVIIDPLSFAIVGVLPL